MEKKIMEQKSIRDLFEKDKTAKRIEMGRKSAIMRMNTV